MKNVWKIVKEMRYISKTGFDVTITELEKEGNTKYINDMIFYSYSSLEECIESLDNFRGL